MNIEEQLRNYLRTSGVSRYRLARFFSMPESLLSKFLSGGTIYLKSAVVMADKLNLQLIQRKKPVFPPKKPPGRPRKVSA